MFYKEDYKCSTEKGHKSTHVARSRSDKSFLDIEYHLLIISCSLSNVQYNCTVNDSV
jgi:hypothetical protein